MSLDVYLHGERIGVLLREAGNGYSFFYVPDLVRRLEPGAPLLSWSLPLRTEPFCREETRAYIEGLLPQGPRRRQIAEELGVAPGDGYALLAELGADCPGAVVFLPEGERPVPREPDSLAWLTDYELEELLCPEPECLFDPENPQRMRFALGGRRHKLALVRDENGEGWAWPEPGVPSTHIIKPMTEDRPDLLVNEMAFTTAYRAMGLPVAHVSLEIIAGQPCLVSKRFDRWGEGVHAERLHQESLSQAFGVPPRGRQGRGPTETPTLADSCDLLREIGEEQGAWTLMIVAFCNRIIGNCEDHGPNSALLYTEHGSLLAPFYDIASTEVYGDVRPTPVAIGEDLPPAPFLVDLARIAAECGFEFQPAIIEAVKAMGKICTAVNATVAKAQEEGWYARVLDEALQCATARSLGFREEMQYLRPGPDSP